MAPETRKCMHCVLKAWPGSKMDARLQQRDGNPTQSNEGEQASMQNHMRRDTRKRMHTYTHLPDDNAMSLSAMSKLSPST